MFVSVVKPRTWSSIWLDRHKVIRDDGHVMAIERELLDALSTGVDEA
jgi:hypothetical protein